jgi:hypothetical protein
MPTPEPPLWANGQYLYDLCHAVLVAADGLIVAPATTPLGANARKYVSHGPPCWDCGEQLTVNIDRIRSMSPLTRSQQRPQGSHHFVPGADISVWLLRCVTTLVGDGEIPDASVLDGETLGLMKDGQALWGGLIAQSVAGTLFPTMHRGSFLWRGCEPVGPNSGLAGWRATLEVALA